MSVSRRMAEVMNETRLNNSKLGRVIGISHTAIGNIREGNPVDVKASTVVNFLYYFKEISPDWLLFGEGEKTRTYAYGVLIDAGITQPLDPNVRDMIIALMKANEGLTKQNEAQREFILEYCKK